MTPTSARRNPKKSPTPPHAISWSHTHIRIRTRALTHTSSRRVRPAALRRRAPAANATPASRCRHHAHRLGRSVRPNRCAVRCLRRHARARPGRLASAAATSGTSASRMPNPTAPALSCDAAAAGWRPGGFACFNLTMMHDVYAHLCEFFRPVVRPSNAICCMYSYVFMLRLFTAASGIMSCKSEYCTCLIMCVTVCIQLLYLKKNKDEKAIF